MKKGPKMLRSNFLDVGGPLEAFPETLILSHTPSLRGGLLFDWWRAMVFLICCVVPTISSSLEWSLCSPLTLMTLPESLVIFLLTLSPLDDNHWSHLNTLSPTGLTNCSPMPFKWYRLVFWTRYEYLALFAPPPPLSYHHLMNKMIAVSNFKPNESIVIVRMSWFFNEVCHVIKILLPNVYIWLYFEIFIQIIGVIAPPSFSSEQIKFHQTPRWVDHLYCLDDANINRCQVSMKWYP